MFGKIFIAAYSLLFYLSHKRKYRENAKSDLNIHPINCDRKYTFKSTEFKFWNSGCNNRPFHWTRKVKGNYYLHMMDSAGDAYLVILTVSISHHFCRQMLAKALTISSPEKVSTLFILWFVVHSLQHGFSFILKTSCFQSDFVEEKYDFTLFYSLTVSALFKKTVSNLFSEVSKEFIIRNIKEFCYL